METVPYFLAVISVLLLASTLSIILLYIRTSRNSQKMEEIIDLFHRRNASDRNKSLAVVAATLDFRLRPGVRTALRDLRVSETSLQRPWMFSLNCLMDGIRPVAMERAGSSKVAVCSVALGKAYQDVVAPCLQSHAAYARRHNYDYYTLDRLPAHVVRPAAWMKIPLIAKLLAQGHDHVMYIDADAMITNPEAGIDERIRDLEASKACLLLTGDGACANTGVMFLKNCSASKALLELIWSYDADIDQGTWEQFALNFLMENYAEVRRNVLIEPNPKTFNSFPIERNLFHQSEAKNLWSKGDFICHFSGIRQPHLQDLIKKYVRDLGSVAEA